MSSCKVAGRQSESCHSKPRDAGVENDWRLKRIAPDRLTAPTVAEGKVFVGLTDGHTLVAMEETSGKVAWTCATGGRLDVPPTVYAGLCRLGSHDGWVYCLRAADGQLAWRFRAAPLERRIVAFGQVESSWPVIGGVLVTDGVAYAAAGIGTETDGGCYVSALEARTGRLIWSGRRGSAAEKNYQYGLTFIGAVNLVPSRYAQEILGIWTAPLAFEGRTVYAGGLRMVGWEKVRNPDIFARKLSVSAREASLWSISVAPPSRVESIVDAHGLRSIIQRAMNTIPFWAYMTLRPSSNGPNGSNVFGRPNFDSVVGA